MLALLLAAGALAERDHYLLDYNWKFELNSPTPPQCPSTVQWPVDLSNKQCLGLTQVQATDANSCLNACCAEATCETYQVGKGSHCAGLLG